MIYKPGDVVPWSGIYKLTHEPKHEEPHEVTCLEGQTFPSCCAHPRFVLQQAAVDLSMTDKRFIAVPVECPSCKVRQKIHVAARPGPTLVASEMVRCLNCDHYFEANVTDKLVAGPFPV